MIQNLIQWYYKRKALIGLRRKYRLEMAVDRVLKDWITACIIERKQEFRREELVQTQKKIAEGELFYKWLNAQK